MENLNFLENLNFWGKFDGFFENLNYFEDLIFEWIFYVSRQPKLLKLRNSVDDGKLNEDTMAKKQKSEEKKKNPHLCKT